MSIEGLLTWKSPLGARQCLDRLSTAIGAAGLTIFAHVDHAAAAKAVGLALPPLDLVIFGNPRAGTPLMAAAPTLGIDLPLRALVWQDAAGASWLSFNAPAWITARHALPDGYGKVVDAMASLLADLADKTVSAQTGA